VFFVPNAMFMLVRLNNLVIYVVSFPMYVNVAISAFLYEWSVGILWYGEVWFMYLYWK
jgi:hypothetical protein